MRNFLKSLAGRILKPTAQKYLEHPRSFSYRDLDLMIRPGVFHPGLFISTKVLVRFLDSRQLFGKYFLELGAGSGLISLYAKNRGAEVTATDLSPAAVANIEENAKRNDLEIEILQSDLFAELQGRYFDLIVVNPPYYPKDPQSEAENAWYCGANFEYFRRLFEQVPDFIGAKTEMYMILSEDCDLTQIPAIAAEHGLTFTEVHQEKKMSEVNYIFRIQ